MASIDNRIVNMEFNNTEFERRVSDTMKTLLGLDKALAETGKGEGLKNISDTAKNFNLDGMSSAIEGVSAKFIALSTIGITALANLTNKAIDAGINMAKALAITPISQGFSEYELKIGSIQTIMAGTGESLDVVNKKLQELNAYSDKTIYSFADMTQNIGKFTNAGIDLDTSVAAIQGVAQVAALSGANAEEASRAMYNFGQALGKGSVQAIDWKSIDLANMGTVEFKQQLIDGAVAMGTLTQKGDAWVTSSGKIVNTAGEFQDSLKENWLTTDVLTSTLGKYADASTEIGKKAFDASTSVRTFSQWMDVTKETVGSGWSSTFEILFGNFDEATWLFSGLNQQLGKLIGDNADKRNQMLQGWKDMGGWGETIIGFDAAIRALGKMFAPIKDAFQQIFPPMTSERLFAITHQFMLFAQSLTPSEETVKNIGRIFKGLFNVIGVGIDVIKFLVISVKDFLKALIPLGNGKTLEFFAELGDLLASISADTIISGIEATFGKLIELLKWPIPYIHQFIDAIVDFVSKIDIDIPETGSIGEFLESIKGWFKDLGDLPDVGTPIANAFNVIKTALSDIGSFISGAISKIDVGGVIGSVLSAIGGAFQGIIDGITGMFSSGGELEKGVKEKSSGIPWDMIMGGVGIAMVGALIKTVNNLVNNGINIDFTGGVLSSISDTFGQLTGTLKTMQQSIKADMLLKIAASIGVLAVSMVVLSMIDPEKLVKAAIAIGVAFGEIAAAMKIMTKIKFDSSDAAKFTLMALGFGILAGAMVLLSGALVIIGNMKPDELAKGMAAFGAVVGALVVMSKNIEKEAAGMAKAGFAMIEMAFSMDIMYGSIKKFAVMNFGDFVQGFAGVALALGLLVGAMKLLPEDMKEKTTGVLGFSIALNLMVHAIKTLGQMDLGTLVQGGIAFAGMMAILVEALRLMPSNMGVTAGQFLALAGAILVMSVALKIIGSMSFGDMVQGLIGMAAALVILVVAMAAAEEGIVGAGAILIMSAALLLLSVAIKAFAALGLVEFATGMVFVALAMGVLAGASMLLEPAIPMMLGVGAGLALIGAGFALIGVGAIQFAKAIAILAGVEDVGNVITDVLISIGKALPALFVGIGEGIGALIEVLAGFVPQMIAFGIKLLGGLLDGLIVVVPKILEFIGVLISGIIDLIITLIPKFASAGVLILIGMLEGISEAVPRIVTVVGEIITGFLTALAEQLPPIIGAVVDLFAALITSVAEGLGELMPTLMIGVGVSFMTGFFDGITQVAGQLWDLIKTVFNTVIDTVKSIFGINSPSTVMLDIGIDLIMGLYNGVMDTIHLVWDFFGKLASEVLRFIGNVTRTLWNKGSDLITGLKNGIDAVISTVTNFFTGLAGDILGWIGDLLETLKSKGRALISGLWNGIDERIDAVTTWFEGLGEKIKGWIGDGLSMLYNIGKNIVQGLKNGLSDAWHIVTDWITGKVADLKERITNPFGLWSPSRWMIGVGGYLMEGLAIGLDRGYSQPADSMDNVVTGLQSTLTTAVSELNAISSGLESDFHPVITPVIDLTNVRAGVSTIGGLLGSSSYLAAGAIANSQQYTEESVVGAGPTEIKFEQTINAPTQLSTADIYRQTRNQITMAKEELSIV
jgi:phage-related protein